MMNELILRIDKAGQPQDWIVWQQAVIHYVKGQVLWTLGNSRLRIHGGMSRLQGLRSYIDVHPVIAVNGQIDQRRFNRTPPLTNSELFRRDRFTCMYCLQVLPVRDLTRDHVIPVSRGGCDIWTNVVTACVRCNQHKGSKLVQETRMVLHAVPYAPKFAEWLILSNRRILVDQMSFLRQQLE